MSPCRLEDETFEEQFLKVSLLPLCTVAIAPGSEVPSAINKKYLLHATKIG